MDEEGACILYVAATRARRMLLLNDDLSRLMAPETCGEACTMMLQLEVP